MWLSVQQDVTDNTAIRDWMYSNKWLNVEKSRFTVQNYIPDCTAIYDWLYRNTDRLYRNVWLIVH